MARKKNFLDYIPAVSSRNTWEVGKNGMVTIHMVHRGFYAWIAQTFFHRPRISHIDLDRMGSFIFRQIDGKQSVGEIAELVKKEFGEEAEPLYGRLVKYMQILRNNEFIYYAKKGGKPKEEAGKGDEQDGNIK
ncbi:MAG: PqqD family protein [Clostridiales bacterium]|nr:PqqD family protein [Clostridiales bacterium]